MHKVHSGVCTAHLQKHLFPYIYKIHIRNNYYIHFYTFAHLKRRLNDKKIYKNVKIWL